MPHPGVDEYLKTALWPDESAELRRILLDTPLTEEVKWKSPCYTFEGNNVAIIGELKACCTLGFFKGALLKDPENILIKPGKNCRAARRITLNSVEEIKELETTLRAYVLEAIELERAGKKVDFSKNRDVEIPEELQAMFDADPAFQKAFEALTPGRVRGYLLHFSEAKQSKTRTARIEKYREKILNGKGMHDWK